MVFLPAASENFGESDCPRSLEPFICALSGTLTVQSTVKLTATGRANSWLACCAKAQARPREWGRRLH